MNENEKTNWRDWTAGQWLAKIAEFSLGLVIAAFLMPHTLNAFDFVFPSEQAMYRYFGFGLTAGALIAYIIVIKYGKLDSMNQTVAIVMMFVSAVAELIVAGFGMQIEAFRKANLIFSPEDVTMLIRVIQVLAGVHALALIIKMVGVEVLDAFSRRSAKIPPQSSIASHPLKLGNSNGASVNQSNADFTD